MSIRSTVSEIFEQVAEEHKVTLSPLADDLPLVDCGLDSLGVAVVMARLEDQLGNDPFLEDEDLRFPETFGEFVRCYEALGKV